MTGERQNFGIKITNNSYSVSYVGPLRPSGSKGAEGEVYKHREGHQDNGSHAQILSE